jgi:dCTP deaminase
LLADFEIRKAVQDGWISVEPFDETRLQPVSLDLTLDDSYARFRDDVHTIDTYDDGYVYSRGDEYHGLVPSWKNHTTGHTISRTGLILRPGDFILACTRETIHLGTAFAARVEGKSSLGRLGVAVHITAGFVDPGFKGQITLEIANLAPVKVILYPGMPIAQIVFEPVSQPERDYSKTGHYQGQTGPTPSRYRHTR